MSESPTPSLPTPRPARSLQVEQLTQRLIDHWHAGELGQLTSEDMVWIVFSLGVACQLEHEMETAEAKRRR